MKIHPLADLTPKMTAGEYDAFKADIAANGIKLPVMLFEGRILDGRHRAKASEELSVALPTQDFIGTAQQARAYVLSLNAHRRSLTAEQKRELIAAELVRDPSQSNVSIAAKARVSDKTVAKARASAEANLEIPNMPERRESTGRKARGTKPGRKINKRPLAERLADITRLAAAGHNASQIAAELGIGAEHVRDLVCEHKVVVPTAFSRKPRRHISAPRVIEETVNALTGMAQGLQLIRNEPIELRPEHAATLYQEANEAMTSIRWLLSTLKESANA